LCSPPAALSGHDLIALAGNRAHHYRLHYTLGGNGVGQLLQPLGIEVAPRLIAATLEQIQRQGINAVTGGGRLSSFSRIRQVDIAA
jgi:hypothetical protein